MELVLSSAVGNVLDSKLCFIQKLPNEILDMIFSYMMPWTSRPFHTYQVQACSTLYVCTRWRYLFEPILYRNIKIPPTQHFEHSRLSKSLDTAASRAQKLYKALNAAPERSSYVREIDFHFGSPSLADTEAITQILLLCLTIRKVVIRSSWLEEGSQLVDALLQLPRLEELYLEPSVGNPNSRKVEYDVSHCGYSTRGPSVNAIILLQNSRHVKRLHLQSYGAFKAQRAIESPMHTDYAREKQAVSQKDLDSLLHPENHRCGSMTEIWLSRPVAPAITTEHILRLPARLTSLHLTGLNLTRIGKRYSVSDIQRFLGIHQQTLKQVTLGLYCHRRFPNFSRCIVLESLTVSRYNLLQEDPAHSASKLPTSLHRLKITFDWECPNRLQRGSDFGAIELRWLTNLMEQLSPRIKLRELFLDFIPTNNPSLASPRWPWFDILSASLIARKLGHTIRSPRPRFNEVEWNLEIEYLRDSAKRKWLEDRRNEPSQLRLCGTCHTRRVDF